MLLRCIQYLCRPYLFKCMLARCALVSGSILAALGEKMGEKAALYRPDGVRIAYDPYAPGMAAKYGVPGKTDDEGFNPYQDTVGPGIYGGVVKRDDSGEVVWGAGVFPSLAIWSQPCQRLDPISQWDVMTTPLQALLRSLLSPVLFQHRRTICQLQHHLHIP